MYFLPKQKTTKPLDNLAQTAYAKNFSDSFLLLLTPLIQFYIMNPHIKIQPNTQNPLHTPLPSLTEDLQLKLHIHEPEDKLQTQRTNLRNNQNQNPPLSPSKTTQNQLQTLAFANHISLTSMINWAQELVLFLQGEALLYHSPFPGLIFQSLKTSKDPHYCIVRKLYTDFAFLKLRGTNGKILSYKVVPNELRVDQLTRIAKKLGPKGILLVWDEFDSQQLALSPQPPSNHCHLIYMNRHLTDNQPWKQIQYHFRQCHNLQIAYHPKVLTKINLEQQIQQSIEFQQEDMSLLNSLTQFHQQIPYDRSVLLVTLMRQENMSHQITGTQIISTLQQNINSLKNLVLRINLNKNKHLACKSTHPQRKLCCWCKKRKTDMSCAGCQSVFQKELNFCVGECMMNYHLYIQELSSTNKKQQICRDIKLMTNSCKLIDHKIGQLILATHHKTNQHHSKSIIPDYMDYMGKQILSYFNLIAQRQLQRKTEQTNPNS